MPDEAVAVIDPPSTVDDQPTPEPEASPPEGEPAPQEQPEPVVEEPKEPEVKVTPEAASALWELGESELLASERGQQAVQREAQRIAAQQVQQQRTDFTLDTEWQQVEQNYQQATQAYTERWQDAQTLYDRLA